jgi:hypothetical protein
MTEAWYEKSSLTFVVWGWTYAARKFWAARKEA